MTDTVGIGRRDVRDKRGRFEAIPGPRALDRYLEAEGKGRLIQSLKSYVADRSFQANARWIGQNPFNDAISWKTSRPIVS